MTFDDWLRAQLPTLLRFATVLCGGPDPAEEVVQDAAVKVHARWARISKLDHPEAYVRRMIVNEYLSWRRKWSRIIPQAEFVDRAPSTGPDFTDQYADRLALLAELEKLPRKQRAVLVLRFFEGLADRDIADLLGCSEVTVRSHASRALAVLRIEMRTPSHRTTDTDTEEGSRAQ